MPTWNLGANDVSEETRTFREKLASKDSQIASQEVQILKQGVDLEELQSRLNETLHKLSSESTSDEHQARGTKLEKEKSNLQARIKELEANLRAVSQATPTIPCRRIPKPRSSSLSNIRINALEQDSTGLRSQLTNKDAEVEQISQKLSRALEERNKADNEKVASERRWQTRVQTLQTTLDEKEEELAFLRQCADDGSREEELLKRIEEDGARIAALEMMLKDAEESKKLKEKLRQLETQLKDEWQRRVQIDKRYVFLAKEREEAFNLLDEARQEAARFAKELEERELRDNELNERANRSLKLCHETTDNFQRDADTISHLERLLLAVDRLREERDGLRRDLQFLESESRFTIEALERKLVTSSVSVYSEGDNITVKTLDQMKNEMDELHARFAQATEDYAAKLYAKNDEIRRLGISLQGLAVAFNRMSSFRPPVSSTSLPISQKAGHTLEMLEEKYEVTVLCLEAMTSQRDDLLVQLQDKDAEWEKEIRMTHQEMDGVKKAVDELNAHIDHIESERDSLSLQVTNLTTDLQNAQDELTNAESRYTNLQFHQLSNMTSNEATRTLREHIEELEARVMRRTEQIGIHQHDIRRLETNLRLQEERLSELMTELEMMAAQKDAMVEDCADAREARDEALARIEALDEELETSTESEKMVIDLIAVVVDTASRGKAAIRCVKEAATSREEELQNKIVYLETELDTRQRDHNSAVYELVQQQKELESRLQEDKRVHHSREQLLELKAQHIETIASLQQQLVDGQGALEELQVRYKSAEVDRQIALEDATSSIKELEEQLEITKRDLDDMQRRQSLFHVSEKEKTEKIANLEQIITQLSQDYHQVLRGRDDIEKEKLALAEELERIQCAQERLLGDLRDEHLAAQQQLEKKLQKLQESFEENTRLLDVTKDEAAQLVGRLRDVTEGRAADRREHELALQSAGEQSERLEKHLFELEHDLHQAESRINTSEDEKTALQQEITTLGAEIQKLKSINRYIEAQCKDSEHLIAILKADTERLEGELAHSEKACKAAEVNLSLQNAQQKRETADLQRELSALRLRPNLEAALHELEERNNEMDELLRSKCAEIEAHDDRVLEMLKEKKKLATKVESLNRKVHNLQAKLAAAKASIVQEPSSGPQVPAVPSAGNSDQTVVSMRAPSRPRAITITQASSLPPPPLQTSTPPMLATRNAVQRTVSGPSSLPKPKTPERNRTHVPVFKARTPERTGVDLTPASVLIGKKRAAPDDFEAIENLPAQAFSADGKDAENRTPRVRRVLSSLQSSFTPNRNRPNVPLPSPKRPENPLTTPYMVDVTNSPFSLPSLPPSSIKPSKRSWLGKIRGTSQAVERPTSSTRVYFGVGEPT